MKKIIFLLSIAIFFSCKQKLSIQDRLLIQAKIDAHQSSYGAKFKSDSINYYNSYVLMNAGLGEARAREIADSLIKKQYEGSNEPYNPSFDPNLTYDKFIKYCNEKKYDPVINAKMLK